MPPAGSEIINNFNSFLASLNVGAPSWDVFIILFFLLASFIYGLSLGRDRIIIILMSVYVALVVVESAPWLSQINPAQLGITNIFVFKIGVFLATFVAVFFLLSRSDLLLAISRADAPGRWWQVIVFSFLHVGLLISVCLSFLPADAAGQLAPLTRQMFVGQDIKFFWIIAPIIALALVREKNREKRA